MIENDGSISKILLTCQHFRLTSPILTILIVISIIRILVNISAAARAAVRMLLLARSESRTTVGRTSACSALLWSCACSCRCSWSAPPWL
jgi:hypothetical protein